MLDLIFNHSKLLLGFLFMLFGLSGFIGIERALPILLFLYFPFIAFALWDLFTEILENLF